MIIRSINGIFANRSDKAPLISLRYSWQCKPDFVAFCSQANKALAKVRALAVATPWSLVRRFYCSKPRKCLSTISSPSSIKGSLRASPSGNASASSRAARALRVRARILTIDP
jgi:hypothetical protein